MAPPPLAEEPDDEDWLVTYADAITLLMAFFIMLVSFSKIDLPLFEEVMSGIQQEIGLAEAKETTTSEVKSEIEQIVFETGLEQDIEVQKDERGVTISLTSARFFKPATAILTEEAKPALAKWSEILVKEEYKFFLIEVEGHTDSDPIHTDMFPSNWELSAARAAAVVRFMQGEGVHKFQLKASGFGDAHPKALEINPDGTPNKVNKAKNRRVEILLVPMGKQLKETFQDVLLEERLAEERRRREAEHKAKQETIQERLEAAEEEEAIEQRVQEKMDRLETQERQQGF